MGNIGWSAFVVFLAMRLGDVANLVNKVILGRYLNFRDFGAVDPILSAVAVLALPVTVIFQVGMKSISRLHAVGEEEQRRALVQDLSKAAVAGAILSVVAVYALKPYLLDRLHLEGDVYIHLLAALFVMAWANPLLSAVLQGEHRYGVLVLPSVVSGVGVLLATWGLVVVFSTGLPGAILSRVVSGLLAAVALIVVMRRSFVGPRRSYGNEWGVILRAIVPMAAYACGTAALVHFDRLLVRNFLLNESGGYGAVVTFGSIPQYFLGALTFVVFPVAAGEHAKGGGLDRYRRAAAMAGMAVTAGCAVFFAVFGQRLLAAWNPAFAPYGDALWVYSVAMGLHGMIDLLVSIEMARHRYGFLWLLVLPAAGYCFFLYAVRASLGIMPVVWAGVGVRAVVLACLWQYGMRRGQAEESDVDGGVAETGERE
jgi:O-antigen/teichoic acid export membrane protein